MAKIEEKVESLVKDKIEKIGYELYDVIYTKEGSNKILRIVIDSGKGISLDDCEKVNNEIKETIDEANPIEEQYFLEISSPGIERLLRKDWQLKKFKGEEVNIKLFKKDENGKNLYNRMFIYQWIENIRKLGLQLSFAKPESSNLEKFIDKIPECVHQ